MSERQSPGIVAKILGFRHQMAIDELVADDDAAQARDARDARLSADADLYPEISSHRITGSKNLMIEAEITEHAMRLRQVILHHIPATSQRAHVMELLVDFHNGALSCLGMLPSGDKP